MFNFYRDWIPRFALKQLSFLTLGNFCVYLTGFLYGVFSARILGPKDFGQLILIIAWIRLFSTPFLLHLGSPLVKLVRQKMDRDQRVELRRTVSSAFVVQTLSMVLFGLMFAFFLISLPPYWDLFRDWQYALGFFALSDIVMRIRQPVNSIFQATEDFELKAFYRSIVALARNFIPVLFMFYGVVEACVGYLLSECLLALVTMGFVTYYRGGRVLEGIELRPSRLSNDVRELFHNARSNYASQILETVFEKLQPLLIGHFTGSTEVGYFNIGKKGNKLFRFAAQPVKTYLFPRFVEKWERRRDEFYYTLRKYFWMAIPLFTGLGGGICLVAPWLIPFFYGAPFTPAVQVVFVLVPAVAVSFVFTIFGPLTFVLSRQRALFNISAVKCLFGLPLVFVLTYWYSYLGAAWASAITLYVLTLYKIYFFTRHLDRNWLVPETARRSGTE